MEIPNSAWALGVAVVSNGTARADAAKSVRSFLRKYMSFSLVGRWIGCPILVGALVGTPESDALLCEKFCRVKHLLFIGGVVREDSRVAMGIR